jgi:hypothetical protein
MNPHLWWFHGEVSVKIPKAFGLWVCHPRRCRCQSPWLSINLESSQYRRRKHLIRAAPHPCLIFGSPTQNKSHIQDDWLTVSHAPPIYMKLGHYSCNLSIYLGPLTINLILKMTDYWLAKLIDWFAISNFLPFINPNFMSMGGAWELLEFSAHILQWTNISENVEMKKPWREIGVGGSVLNTNPSYRALFYTRLKADNHEFSKSCWNSLHSLVDYKTLSISSHVGNMSTFHQFKFPWSLRLMLVV